MKVLLKFLLLSLFFVTGCQKEANRKLLNAYFRYEVNGTKVNITQGILLNENLFECRFSGDSAVQILAGKVYEVAGIYFSDDKGIENKTYVLDDRNKAFYMNPADQKRYSTTNKFTGTITVKKGTFQAKTLLSTLEGSFAFNVVDTASGKSFKITNGEFLMETQ